MEIRYHSEDVSHSPDSTDNRGYLATDNGLRPYTVESVNDKPVVDIDGQRYSLDPMYPNDRTPIAPEESSQATER